MVRAVIVDNVQYQFSGPHSSKVMSIRQSDHDRLASVAQDPVGDALESPPIRPNRQQVHSTSLSIAKHMKLITEELLELKRKDRVDATSSKHHLIFNRVLGTDWQVRLARNG